MGEPEETDPGVWKRDFENGSVTVDLDARSAKIGG